MRILLVDDNQSVLETFQGLLEAYGHDVAIAPNGQEGYNVWCDNDPCDIVFCDLDMPVMDGFGFLARMRENTPIEDQIPIYIVSGNDPTPELYQRLKEYNAGFILKGLDAADDILEAVNALG